MGVLFRRPQSATVEVYAGMQVPVSVYGGGITLAYGRTRLAPTLGWYGNFVASQQSSGGKGGSGNSGAWDYNAAWLGILCIGPIRGINTVFQNKTITTLADENLSLSLGGAIFEGSINGALLDATYVEAGGIEVGSTITLVSRTTGIPQNVKVESNGTGEGGVGTYNLSANCGVVPAQLMYASAPISSFLESYEPPSVAFQGYVSAGYGLTAAGNILTVTLINTGNLLSQMTVDVSGSPTIVDPGAAGGGVGSYVISGPALVVGSPAVPVNLTASMGATGSQAIPYDKMGYVLTGSYDLGSSAALPNDNFEVDALLGYDIAAGMFDADPSAFVPDYLTEPVHGAGFLGTISNLQGLENTFQAYVMAMGLLLSPQESTQRQASSFLQDIMQCTNSDIVLSCGNLTIVPYADQAVAATTPDGNTWSWTPNFEPIFSFGDGDYVIEGSDADPVQLEIKPKSETYNDVNVEFLDRSNYYNTAIENAYDLTDIIQTQRRTMPTVTLHMITQPAVARVVAQLIMQFSLHERRNYRFKVRGDYFLLDPMDPIALTDATLGLTNQLARILEITYTADGLVEILAQEITGVTRSTPQYNWSVSQGYYANYGADPGLVQAPLIFVMPNVPQSTVQGGIQIGIAVAGQSDNAAWGGCQIYLSTDGGDTYQQVGTSGALGASRYGTLGTALPAGAAQPDIANTFEVALADTNLQISTAVTHADADAVLSLMLIDSGANAEVISYGTCTALVGVGEYDISYLWRGLFGSNNVAHAADVPFACLDGAIYQIGVDPGMAGRTLYFKFVSFNIVGRSTQDVSSVEAYAYTIPAGVAVQGNVALLARGSCVLSDENLYKVTTGASAWDSDCVSVAPISNGCQAIARLGQAGQGLAIGLVISTAETLDPNTNMNFSINQHGGLYGIFEGGIDKGYVGGAALKGDILQVIYDGWWVRYSINGVQVWQTAAGSGLAFYFGAAMYDPGDALGSVEFTSLAAATPSQWVATGNCVVNDNNVSKVGGVSAWDSCAYSLTGYMTCHVVGKSNGLTDTAMIGLSQEPAKSSSYVNMDYGWYATELDGDPLWQIYEAGADTGVQLPRALTDVAAVTYDGTYVRYWMNGVEQVHFAEVLGRTLFGFCPFYLPGSGFNSLTFGPTTSLAVVDTPQLGDNAATDVLTASVMSGGAGSEAAAVITGLSVTVGPYPTDMTVVLDFNGTWQNTGRAGILSYSFCTADSEPFGGFGPEIESAYTVSSGGNDQGVAVVEATYDLPANTTVTFYVFAVTIGSITGITFGNPTTLKAEVIKR